MTMNKITKLLAGGLCALALTTIAASAATVNLTTPTVTPTSFYNAKEFGLTVGSGYTLGGADTIGAATFQQPYSFNLNAGAFYFPWRNLGFEASVPFYQTKGVSVSEVQAGLLFRLPLAKETAILKDLSPYVGAGGVYNWNSAQEWAYIGKVGLEFRINKKWGTFVEGQYRNSEFKNWGSGQCSLVGGLHLVF